MSDSDYQRGYRDGYRDGQRDAKRDAPAERPRPAATCKRTGRPIGSCGCDACDLPYGP